MRRRRRVGRSVDRSPWMRAGLALVDATRGPQRLLGIDPPSFRVLMALRLTLDLKPRRDEEQAGNPLGAGIVPLTAMCLLMGVMLSLVGLMADGPSLIGILLSGSLLFYGPVVMVSLFADLLFDRAGGAFLAARPVEDRTVLAARVAPIVGYVAVIEGALALTQVGVGVLRFGIWPFFPLALAAALLAGLLAVAVVLFALALALRLTSVGRFKRIVTRLQIALTIGLVALPQLANVFMMSFRDGSVEELGLVRWRLLLPPVWFGDLVGPAGAAEAGANAVPGTLLAILVPAALLLASFRLIRGRFIAGSTGPEEEDAAASAPARGIVRRLTDAACSTRAQRAGYGLCAALGLRERAGLMRTLPILLMGPMVAAGMAYRFQDGLAEGLFLILYGLALGAVPLVQNLRYSADADAAWVMDVAPTADGGSLLTGALRATIVRFTVVPAAAAALAAGLFAGPGALVDCVGAGAFGVVFTIIAAAAVGHRRPYSETFDKSEAMAAAMLNLVLSMFAALVAMLHVWARGTVPGRAVFVTVTCVLAAAGFRRLARIRLRDRLHAPRRLPASTGPSQ